MHRTLLVALVALVALTVAVTAGCHHDPPPPVALPTPPPPVAPPLPPPDVCPDQADGVAMTPSLLVTPRVEFDLYRSTIAPASLPIVDSVARRMVACTALQLEVQVHTDTVRDGTFNLRASQQVADAIRARLVAQGVAASRVVACGYGESQPLTQQPQWQGSPNARVVWHRIDVPMATFHCPTIASE